MRGGASALSVWGAAALVAWSLGCGEAEAPKKLRAEAQQPAHDAGARAFDVDGAAELDGAVPGQGDAALRDDRDHGIEGFDAAAPAIEVEPVRGRRVLMLAGGKVDAEHTYTLAAKRVLRAHRLEHELRDLGDAELAYEDDGVGAYAAIVVTDYAAYEQLASEERARLEQYCRRHAVGIYFLHVPPDAELEAGRIVTSPSIEVRDQRLDARSGIAALLRDGGTLEGVVPGKARPLQVVEGDQYVPVAWASDGAAEVVNVLADDGSHDGVRRVLSGHDFNGHFFHELLFVDALQWLSPNDLGVLRERYLQVDIDDIFMPNWSSDPAQRDVKIQRDDVEEMLATQRYVSSLVEGDFRFALGFNSGFYEGVYAQAPYDDADGDHALVEHRAEFHWFDHMPRHEGVLGYDQAGLEELMQESRQWAADHDVLDYVTQYAVTPRHDGIGTRYEPLFLAWRQVWDVRYTSATSVHPCFEVHGVLGAHRLNFMLWSGEHAFDRLTREEVDRAVEGGFYFDQIVENPVAIFMTHQANYARDRVALYIVERLVAFVRRWTSLQLIAGTPDEAVQRYDDLLSTDCE